MATLLSEKNDVIVVSPILESNCQPGFERIGQYRVYRSKLVILEKLKARRILYRLMFTLLFALRMVQIRKSLRLENSIHLIQAEQQYSLLPAFVMSLLSGAPLILDDALDSRTLNRELSKPSGFFVLAFETIFFRACHRVLAASKDVSSALYRHYNLPCQKLHVVPNGVSQPQVLPKENENTTEKNIIFMGSMYSKQNIRAICNLIRIFKVIRDEVNGVRLMIIGGPLDLLYSDATFQKLRNLQTRDIMLKGRISEQEKVAILQTASVCVLPYDITDGLTGGARLKALEFLAYGKIVVSTSAGIRGIDGAINGQNVIVSNDFGDFTRRVIDALNNPLKYQRIRENASLLARKYSWKSVLTEYASMIETLD